MLFLQQGYHKTTMDDLAKTCGLQKGSFYHYYASKEALMKAILENSLEIVEKNVFSIAYLENLSAEERLTQLFETQKAMLLCYDAGCLFGNTVLETALVVPEFRPTLKAFFEVWENALFHIFSSKMKSKTARKKAQQTIISVEGALILVLIRNENQYLIDVFQDVLSDFQKR